MIENILLSNDDGVYAEGIVLLQQYLSSRAAVTVVAPDRDRSGASNSLTLANPVRVKILQNGFMSVEGTPTDCVHIAITGLLEQLPDIVISGINAGSNMGDDVWYSGTVAAAMEGRFLSLPAIAVSLSGDAHRHYGTAVKVVGDILDRLISDPLPDIAVLNVNVPDIPYEEVQGMEITRLGTRHEAEPTIKRLDPRGKTIYWVGPPGKESDCGIGTDFYCLSQNKVSITPLRVDITQTEMLESLSIWLGK
jgi:5'-nucleotidase